MAKLILIKNLSRYFISNKRIAEMSDTVKSDFVKATMFESMQLSFAQKF